MKRQFFKVKQFADQTFSRSGKTEALSDTLQIAEKRVEFIKNVCQNTTKKLLATLTTHGLGNDVPYDKRMKKMPNYLLALAMIENGPNEEENLFREILSECSQVQIRIVEAGVQYESHVEQTVINKLQQVLDVDVPNIKKQKALLTKLVLEMDLARARYNTALKNSNSGTSNTNKVDTFKEEFEDIELKVEQCKDSLTSEIFQLISREAELSSILIELIKHQRSYHKAALTVLDEMVPKLETVIDDNPTKPVFGQKLEDHLRVTKRRIAYPIELCICALLELEGVDEEGLFRIAAGASKVRCMKLRLDSNCLDLESAVEYRDPHIIAGVLKSYLRQLPEPLLTHHLYEEWLAASKLQTSESRFQAILNVVQKLPQSNLYNLRYIIKFLAELTKHQDVNKMSPQNLAIVIAPNLLWTPEDKTDNIGLNMNAATSHNIIVDCLISHSDWIFPGEEQFYVTLKALDMNNFGHQRSNSGDNHLISTTDGVTTNLQRSRSSTNITTDTSSPFESPKPHSRGRKNKPAPIPPSPTIKTNNIFESPEVTSKDQDKANCDKPPPGSLLKPSHTTESPREKLPAVDVISLKQLVKPAVAPRTILETSDDIVLRKPAIPERPASLQRPLSSSFRSLRTLSDNSNDKPDVDEKEGPMLERAHLYTLPKQQVSLIQVGDQCDNKEINQHNDIVDTCVNQENSNIDLGLTKSPNLSCHRRTPSDVQTGQMQTLKTQRTQRPIPPPPPPPTASSKKEPESTDL